VPPAAEIVLADQQFLVVGADIQVSAGCFATVSGAIGHLDTG
jgi:hypothetical protein